MSILSNPAQNLWLLPAALIMASSLSPGATAQSDTPWQVRAYGTLVFAQDSFSTRDQSDRKIEAGGNTILGAASSIEYRANTWLGIEAGAAISKNEDFDDDDTEIGEGPGFAPLWIGANFYVFDNDSMGIYVGPRIAAVVFEDFELEVDDNDVKYELENKTAPGAVLGLDYRIAKSRWSIHAELMYLDVDMEVSERGSNGEAVIGFNPVMANIGMGFRF